MHALRRQHGRASARRSRNIFGGSALTLTGTPPIAAGMQIADRASGGVEHS
jgi:hypothetical protein